MKRAFVIAEAGVNHNGSLEMAKDLIRIAKKCGADAVKFQSFRASALATSKAPKATYQKRAGSDTQLEMLKKLELKGHEFLELRKFADAAGIEFFATPFDNESLRELLTLVRVKRLKVASGEITNGPLLLEMARSGLPIILSTGMATLEEVAWALRVLNFGYTEKDQRPTHKKLKSLWNNKEARANLFKKVVVLQCTSQYPAPSHDMNLRAMNEYGRHFGVQFGLSDHSLGILASVAAVARGARTIEKHITLDKKLPGPDHTASLNPEEFQKMVEQIREVETLLGSPTKKLAPSEEETKGVARKSLVALSPIRPGESFTEKNLGVKRPGTGISASQYWEFLGKKANKAYDADDLISDDQEGA